jgi:hypothetical protein
VIDEASEPGDLLVTIIIERDSTVTAAELPPAGGPSSLRVDASTAVRQRGSDRGPAFTATTSAASDDLAGAWDAGYRAAIEDYGCDIPWGGMTSDENPYRQANAHVQKANYSEVKNDG